MTPGLGPAQGLALAELAGSLYLGRRAGAQGSKWVWSQAARSVTGFGALGTYCL